MKSPTSTSTAIKTTLGMMSSGAMAIATRNMNMVIMMSTYLAAARLSTAAMTAVPMPITSTLTQSFLGFGPTTNSERTAANSVKADRPGMIAHHKSFGYHQYARQKPIPITPKTKNGIMVSEVRVMVRPPFLGPLLAC